MARELTPEEAAVLGLPTYTPPDVPAHETFFNRGANAIPGGRPLVDVLTTTILDLVSSGGQRAVIPDEAKAALAEIGVNTEEPGFWDRYRAQRERRAERTEVGSAQSPNAAKAGAALGTVASILAPLPGVTVGANATTRAGQLAGRLGSGAATGAVYGGISGLTDGEADLTRGEFGKAAEETASGAAGGALFGAGAAGAAEAARPLLTGPLRRLAVKKGKETIQGESHIAAKTREPLSDEAVEEVLRAGAIRPLSTTQATAERIEGLARASGDEYGRIVARLEELGVQGPNAQRVADELLSQGQYLSTRTLNDALPAEFFKRAGMIEDIARGGPGQQGPMSSGLALTQAEDMKRSLQDLVRYGRIEETPTNAVRREIASVLRRANEEAVEQAGQAAAPGSEVRALAEQFVPVKQRTGRLLEAERFAQKGASGAEQRSPMSLKDLLVGGMTGDPVSGLALATGSSIARNRLPSTISANAFDMSEALRTGTASPTLARMIAIAADPDVQDTTAYISRLLRERKKRKDDEK